MAKDIKTKEKKAKETNEVKKEKPQKKAELPKKQEKKQEQEKQETRERKPKEEKELNPWETLIYPHLAEKSMNMVEMENKLVFMVKPNAQKNDIREAVEKGFDVRVISVKTEITRKGQKKAYIRLDDKHSAADIASRLGIV